MQLSPRLIPGHVRHPPKNSEPVSSPPPALLSTPRPPAAALLSVSVHLPALDVSSQWNHTVGGLLCLASLTQHHVSRSIHVVA